MPNLTIDEQTISVAAGTTVLQACEQLKIDVPRYCYHPGLSIAGNCRICMVDIEKTPKPSISCQTACTEGMVVHTQTEKVKKLREHVLEFLLINHPVDCPVCDQAGECFLQDYYMQYGLYQPKFNDHKVKKTKKAFPVGPTIMLDQERCILCTRCVRFTDEITKTHEFGMVNRGDHSEITVSREFVNDYSGNVADICPVGALTDRDFRFKCRVWYLKSTPSVCPGCSRGCNIDIHYNDTRPHKAQGERIMRLKPRYNADINKWWICDEGRYGYKQVDQNRLTQIKGADDWDQALGETVSRIRKLNEEHPRSLAVLLSPQLSNEELFTATRLFGSFAAPDRLLLVSPRKPGKEDGLLMKADKNPNTTGARLLGLDPVTDAFTVLKEGVEAGVLRSLYIFGQDLVALYGDAARQLIKQFDLVVFQGTHRNDTEQLATFALPSSVYAEQEGTFTNFDGYIQKFSRVFPPLKGVRTGLAILHDLAGRLGVETPSGTPEAIFERLSAEIPAFSGMHYGALKKTEMVPAC